VSSTKPTNSFLSTKYKSGWWLSFKNNTPSDLTLNPCTSGEFVTNLWSNWKDWAWNGELAYFNAMHWTMDGSGSIYILSSNDVWSTSSFAYIKKYTSSWVLLLTIWSWASWDNNLSGTAALFNHPTYIAVDDQQNIYVTDTWNYKVKKYSSTGAWLLTIGSSRWDAEFGGTDSQFYLPVWVYASSWSFIAVIDWYNNVYSRNSMKIKYYSLTGWYLRTIGNFKGFQNNNLSWTAALLSFPQAMLLNGSWDLIVKDLAASIFKRYTNTWGWMATYDLGHQYDDSAVYNDNYLEQDGSWRIFTFDCASQCIRVYTSTGILLSQIGDHRTTTSDPNQLSWTAAIIVSEFTTLSKTRTTLTNNGIFVTVSPCMIQKYSYTWTWLLTIWTGWTLCSDNLLSWESAWLYSIAISSDNAGSLYVYSTIFDSNVWSYSESKIKKYTSTGTWVMDIGGPIEDNDLSGTGAGITANPRSTWDNVFLDVTNNWNIYIWLDRMKVYTSTGAWQLTIWDGTNGGNYLSDRSAGLSYCMAACALIDNSGSIYIHNGFYFYRKYSSTWAFLFPVGSAGGWPWDTNGSYTGAHIGDSEFWAIDNNNNLYLLDYGNNKIKKYSSTWAWLYTLGSTTDIYYGNNLSGTNAILTPNLGSVLEENSNNWNTYIDDKIQFTRSGSFYYMNSVWDQVKSYSSWWVLLSTLGALTNWNYIPPNDLSGTAAYLDSQYYRWNISLDPSGNLWVQAGMKVKKYSATWWYLLTIGSTTPGDNDLSNGSAQISSIESSYNQNVSVTFDSSWSIYVNTVFPQKVKKYSSTGAWMMTLWSGSNIVENNWSNSDADWYRPYNYFSLQNGIRVDSNNNIFLMTNDPFYYGGNGRRIKKYSATGSWISNIGRLAQYQDQNSYSWILLSDVWNLWDQKIVWDGSWNIWIPFYNNTALYLYEDPWTLYTGKLVFKKYSSTWAHLLTVGSDVYGDNEDSWTGASFRKFLDFFTDRSWNLYVFDTTDLDYSDRKLKKYSSTGAWEFTLPLYTMGWVSTVHVDKDGNIYIYSGDYTSWVIERYDTNGNFVLSFPVSSIYETILSDQSGNLLTNSGNSLVLYDQTGNLLLTLWDELNYWDNELSGTAALFPWDIRFFTYEGDIYVYMYSGLEWSKIKRYSSTGAWLMTIGGVSGWENDLSWTGANFWTGTWIFQTEIDANGVILINNLEKKKIKMYSWLTGDWLWNIGDGLPWVNELSWTGARVEWYMYMNFDRDAFYLFDTSALKIKKYLP
jgi:hypothetical protein